MVADNVSEQQNILGDLKTDYRRFYETSEIDSPPESRISILKRLRTKAGQYSSGNLLDLGSGPQVLYHEYKGVSPKPLPFKLYTLDFATIMPARLGVKKIGAEHIQAKGEQLPFANERFDGVISNLALDFMPRSAIGELYRIMKPGAFALINLHHPYLYRLLDHYLKQRFLDQSTQRTVDFWQYLKDNQMLYESEQQITDTFTKACFTVESTRKSCDLKKYSVVDESAGNYWWEVNLKKP